VAILESGVVGDDDDDNGTVVLVVLVVEDESIRGIVTLKRSLPLICTATVWPPRWDKLMASELVRSGSGHDQGMGEAVSSEVLSDWLRLCIRVSSVSRRGPSVWRISQHSELRAGATGASSRNSDETHTYSIVGEAGGDEASVLVSLVRSDTTVFRA